MLRMYLLLQVNKDQFKIQNLVKKRCDNSKGVRLSVSGAGETKVDGKAHEEGAEICRRVVGVIFKPKNHIADFRSVYESFSDVGEIRVYFASKILTPCRMH